MLSFLGGCAQLIPAISNANPPFCLALGIVSLLSIQNWKVSPHFSINSGELWLSATRLTMPVVLNERKKWCLDPVFIAAIRALQLRNGVAR